MEKAKTSWQAQDLIVGRSLCKPLFFYTDEISGWVVLCGRTDALRVSLGSRRCCMEEQVHLPQEPRNRISIQRGGLALHNMSIGGQGSRNRDGGRQDVRFRHS